MRHAPYTCNGLIEFRAGRALWRASQQRAEVESLRRGSAEQGAERTCADALRTAARVTIVSAASDGTTVTFTGANGVTHTIDVLDPAMRAFVGRLKAGDQVDVAYGAEAVRWAGS